MSLTEEKKLILLTFVFILFSIPHMISLRFAGVIYPEAEELVLIEYDWMVSPGTEACYTYKWQGQLSTNCTNVDESRWIQIQEDGKSVKFFVKTQNISEASEQLEVTLEELSTSVQVYEDISFSYEVKNELAKGRVFHITYMLDGVTVGSRYLRLLPNETRVINDKLHSEKAGDFAFTVKMGDTYDAGRVSVTQKANTMNTALGIPLVLLSFILPFFIILKNKGYVPLLSLVTFTTFVSILNLFDAFDKNTSFIFVGLLWSVSIGARIIYKK
jgi:hypothetical protein